MKLCPNQELCPLYTDGSKRKVHHIRLSNPCRKWLTLECEMGVELRRWNWPDIPISCNIEKVKRIKNDKT